MSMFKSYYVVWKPVEFSSGSDHPVSLNRTMQYGNKSVETSTQVGSEFKSYYVVWKPGYSNLFGQMKTYV